MLAALSQPPVSWPLVLIIALPLLFRLWAQSANNARAFWIGWFAGLGYFGATLHWIVEPFLVQPEIFAWMIPFAFSGMAGGMALFWGAGFWTAKRLCPSGWGAPFALTFGITGMEWLRGNILSGFPWSLPGYAWVETPFMQMAAQTGIYGVTLWTVLTGMLLGAAAYTHSFRRRITLLIPVFVLCLLPVANVMLSAESRKANPGAPRIGLVQPNIAQKDKWQPHLREAHLNDLLDKTRTLSARGADVVIWPEAATPYQLDKNTQIRALIAQALKPGAVLLAGGIRVGKNQNIYNSLIAIDSSGDVLDTYDKQHLVPFGEKMPLEPLLSKIGLRAMISLPGGFSTGQARERLMQVGTLPPFVPMICYEAIFPAEVMRRNAQGDWLVHVTNDAWFGKLAGPFQHLVMARVRAIERGLPVARAANTGVSAIIGADGTVLESLPLNEAGTVLAPLPERKTPTFYSRYEDIPFGLAMLLIFAISVSGRSARRHSTGHHA